mmetsp:Transcript_5564/g.15524  ORF Transcript_5564/g.15524 Transcript_5564/m.15524 type:complete len:243 (+) Transcript_5564:2-730(+)
MNQVRHDSKDGMTRSPTALFLLHSACTGWATGSCPAKQAVAQSVSWSQIGRDECLMSAVQYLAMRLLAPQCGSVLVTAKHCVRLTGIAQLAFSSSRPQSSSRSSSPSSPSSPSSNSSSSSSSSSSASSSSTSTSSSSSSSSSAASSSSISASIVSVTGASTTAGDAGANGEGVPPFMPSCCMFSIRFSMVLPSMAVNLEAGNRVARDRVCCSSAILASSRSGNRLGYSSGSASDSAALGLTF